MLTLFCLCAGLLLNTQKAYSWGQKGHDVTCSIAQNHLCKKAKKEIAQLLDGQSIVYWSNWLDNASNTPEYAYSKTWHYKNVDADQTFESAPVNENGDVLTALHAQTAILKDKKASIDDRRLALKMVIHLMGDLHQPMHMGHKSDLGGNRWKINYFRADNNLHGIWDTQLVESAHKWSYGEWTNELDRLSKAQVRDIQSGTPEEWGKQTFELATQVYEGSPEGSKLSYDYVRTWTPVIEQQFLRGGLRLANVLNEIFK